MKHSLNANAIKLIAIIAMTIDHVAWLIFPGYPRTWIPLLMHTIGRITCPIMCFFIAEGYHHTKNIAKYRNRLFLFALISHFAYLYASAGYIGPKSFIPFYYGGILDQTSVMWPLAWGLVMLETANSSRIPEKGKALVILLICAITFPSDWSCIAAMAVFFMGANRGNFRAQMFWMVLWTAVYALVYFLFLDRIYGLLQLGTCLAIPLLRMHNGQKGRWKAMGKVFYLYYPAHLFACGLLKNLL